MTRGNQHYATPIPDRNILFDLYVNKDMIISEVAKEFNTTSKIVSRWLRKSNIKRRRQTTRQWNKNSFFDYLMPEPNTGCWLWIGCLNCGGYGTTSIKQRKYLAHRLSYEFFVGKIPKSKHLLHKCDTPSCVNPDHLFIGTQKDNIKDMISKGRGAKGESSGISKLKGYQIIEIRNLRKSGMLYKDIAKIYGCSKDTIRPICIGKTWKHI